MFHDILLFIPYMLQILLDGPGILKYADFGLSKVEGENLDELFQKFSDAGELWSSEFGDDMSLPSKKYKTERKKVVQSMTTCTINSILYVCNINRYMYIYICMLQSQNLYFLFVKIHYINDETLVLKKGRNSLNPDGYSTRTLPK